MSRRAPTPDSQSRSKRRLSLRLDSADKRSRGSDDRRDSSASAAAMAAGPSTQPLNSSSSSSSSFPVTVEGTLDPLATSSTRVGYSSPSMSSSSSADNSGTRNHSQRSELSQSRRPTWQTDDSVTGWGDRDQERDRDRDRRDLREQHPLRDSRDRHDDPLLTPRGSTQFHGRPITPPNSYLASGAPLVQPPIKTQAAFVGKLFAMLEDKLIANSGLLCWSPDGTSFVCPNPTEFSKEVLPNYFKHNNWQSFVRQLNMYSFNKVSDLYSTANTDPQAWEFRHPLFRRGEPHLLASIKRKSTRQSQPEGQPLTSPIDELGENPMSKPVAGWMRDPSVQASNVHASQSTSFRLASPPREYTGRAQFHPFPPQAARPVSSVSSALEPPLSSMPHPPPRIQHPPPISAHQLGMASYPDSPFYPQSQSSRPSPVDALNGQVATLQETVQRLSAALSNERVENTRNNLDFTSHLLRVTDWLSEVGKDVRGVQDMLHRQRADLLLKFEALQGTDIPSTVSGVSSGGDDRRGASYEPPPRSIQSLHDPRQVHTSHHQPSPPAQHLVDRIRPATSDPAPAGYNSPLQFGPGHGQFSGRPSMPGYDQLHPHHSLPQSIDLRDPRDRDRDRDRDRNRDRGREREREAGVHSSRPPPLSRRETDPLPPPPQTPNEDIKPAVSEVEPPKTSLRNLLH